MEEEMHTSQYLFIELNLGNLHVQPLNHIFQKAFQLVYYT